ncbi:Major facilitator superfamily domain general substrate transporter [Penicillium samsonianum]|uniref:Major facilitator superfamily domain general substrate transporter n=1 Tax=Penicillium samsonianum TaxID=1882272 RepID=UPI0025476865|nr:Major facilitator superfamily domain general substrate transporter [Penicillium samsonianum]KAJ6137235.1 Major facilitator superfamily domain general substrate transporter [Penicillium samsonianum]
MFQRPACLQGRRSRNGSGDDFSTFPIRQLFVLALVRICEPIAFMSIFPYVYHMVESFHVTDNDRQIALYAGMITSSFTFAEFSAGMFWGRMSDRIGRKPVLIMGLVGTAISMVVFGFAPNLATAMIARALGGMLNGNIGVLQTTVAEIVTKKEHQPRAYSIMPFVWCLGSIIGPAMGGALAQPCDNYPALFARSTLWDKFPFLLPNLVCITVLVCGIVVGFLFLEETHPEKKHRRDPGLELGHWLVNLCWGSRVQLPDDSDVDVKEKYFDAPPGYETAESSPCLRPIDDGASADCDLEGQKSPAPKAFTRQVILAIVAYGILAYHSVSFDQLMPVLLSTPRSDDDVVLPLKFTGGLGMATKTIGFMLAVQGVYSMIAQLWLFPFVVKHFGTLRTFRFVLLVWPPLYLAVPYLVLLPAKLQMLAVYVSLISKITFHVIAFPATAILLANAAPSSKVLGSINGVAASTASLSRAFGPTITGLLHSKGLDSGYSVLAWWACGLVCLIGAIQSFWMEESPEPERFKTRQPEVSESEMKRDALSDFGNQDQDSDELPEEEQRLLSLRSSVDHDFDISQLNLNAVDNFLKPQGDVTHDTNV